MTRILTAALALTLLAGCGAAPVAMQTPPTSAMQAASLKTKYAGTVAKSTLAGQDVLTMTIEAKRPLGKNIVQPYTSYIFMDAKTRRWRGVSSGSRLYLAKDGGLYISAGANDTELWYKVGTYQATGELQAGAPLSYKLDGEHLFRHSGSLITLEIYHTYKTAHGSELEWSEQAPKLVPAN